VSTAAPGCAGFDEDLSALLDGELTPQREQEVRAHLAACPGCSQRLETLRRVDAALRGLPLRPPAAALAERLRERLVAERAPAARTSRRAPGRRHRWFALPAAAAAAAVALAAVLLLPRWLGPGESQIQVAEEPPESLEGVSDEEIELALALEALGDIETVADWDLIQQLDVLERLEMLDARERG
jgi:anti-sigma factor RsiW